MAFKAWRNIFNRASTGDSPEERVTLVGPRIPRHSTGWSAMLKYLRDEESLRVLDIGPTSSSSINFLTGLGHSVCMADILTEANRSDWQNPASEDDVSIEADAETFLNQHLDFNGRLFDVVLLWTTLDYLPEALLAPIVRRLYASLKPGGRILAFFHTKTTGAATAFYRYHLTDGDVVEMQEAERHPVRQVHTNRKIEKLFSDYEGCKFFLAKDNVYEVIVTR
ncbi:hypothetical protein ACPOL_5480 [Acidisarcina polymorpha]|uniref:Methyltransferase type 11 domain-containing protein n=1 Tax=Acidisarcina polymorpha TaxID=2211140 RepID=A0A2Z5G6L2_9BACT|nr:class I SAM-dependent methyltransferase [Acidisarcina polymorpha]AXC14728.1 hypothetical protein ACPOL_5480 [Acidisarcina polymorpha]